MTPSDREKLPIPSMNIGVDCMDAFEKRMTEVSLLQRESVEKKSALNN
jgi:hypothetical protein